MKRVFRRSGLVLMGLALTSAPVSASEPNPFAAPGRAISFGRTFDFRSTVLKETRRVNVLLPEGYDDAKQAGVRYPILYLLDGGAGWQDFFHIAGLVHQGGTWGANAPMIVVGIESKDRRAEFTRPSSDPSEQKDYPTHGKSDAFRKFLTTELKPAITAAFRSNGTEGLIGESLAGLFVLDTALRHGDDFTHYIAVSPSLWWDGRKLARDAQALLRSSSRPPTVWLSMADEGGSMQAGMDQLLTAFRAKRESSLRWTYVSYPNEAHSTVYHPAATRAIRQLFPPPGKSK